MGSCEKGPCFARITRTKPASASHFIIIVEPGSAPLQSPTHNVRIRTARRKDEAGVSRWAAYRGSEGNTKGSVGSSTPPAEAAGYQRPASAILHIQSNDVTTPPEGRRRSSSMRMCATSGMHPKPASSTSSRGRTAHSNRRPSLRGDDRSGRAVTHRIFPRNP
jgi:hypothetical protein